MYIRFTFDQSVNTDAKTRWNDAEAAVQGLMKTGVARKEAMCRLIDAAAELGLMPANAQCAHRLLHNYGYSKVQRFVHGSMTVSETADYLASRGIDKALIVIAHRTCNQGHMQYISREGDHFLLADSVYAPEARVIDVWAFTGKVKEMPNRTHRMQVSNDEEHEEYRFFNPNPQSRATGDCVPRAFCTVMQCTWKEALSMIAEASDYTNTVLNNETIYRKALEKAHYVRHARVKDSQGHSMMPGAFLDYCNKHFTDGQPLFVHVGPTHAVSVVQNSGPDGVTRYVFADSWNSREHGGKIGTFYVGPGRSCQHKVEPINIRFDQYNAVGMAIIHPVFGQGVITSAANAAGHMRLSIQFACGTRLLSSSWVAVHCHQAEMPMAS